MKIQVNLDDVVFDFLGGVSSSVGFLDYLNARTGRKHGQRILRSQLKSYDLARAFEISDEELNASQRAFYSSANFANLSLMPDFLDFAVQTKIKNHGLLAVTSRPRLLYETAKGKESFVEAATLANLDATWVSELFEDLCFLRDDFLGDYSYIKAMYAKEQGVDLVIDHRPDVIDACIGFGVKSVLLTRPWNKNYEVINGVLRLDSLQGYSFPKDI